MTRVVKYGIGRPTEGLAVVMEQLRLKSRYYNTLAEIENGRRDAHHELVDADGTIATLEAERASVNLWMSTIVARLKEERVLRRSRQIPECFGKALAAARQDRDVLGRLLSHARRLSYMRVTVEQSDPRVRADDPSILVNAFDGSEGAAEWLKIVRSAGDAGSSAEEAIRSADERMSIHVVAPISERLPHPLKEIDDVADVLVKSAREHKVAYWGTTGLAENAHKQAKEDTSFFQHVKFKHFRGEGSIGVQIQDHSGSGKGSARNKKRAKKPKNPKPSFTTDKLFSGDSTLVRIDPIDLSIWTATPDRPVTRAVKSGRDPRQRTRLHLRVASDEKKDPIWAVFPLNMHRPLPDGIVKQVNVTRRLIGPREQWTCEITIDEAPFKPQCGSGAVALHCGWHVEHDGQIRVGSWMDEAGNTRRVYIPTPPPRAVAAALKKGLPVLDGFDKAASLASIRSRAFNDALEAVAVWIETRLGSLPAWFVEATWTPSSTSVIGRPRRTTRIRLWRSENRLAGLCRRWAKNRFAGDEVAFEALEKWRYHDHHLWQWQCSARENALRYRKNAYRDVAAMLGKKYGMVVVDDVNYSDLAEAPKPDGVAVSGVQSRQDGSDGFVDKHDATDRNRRRAAPSELRNVVVNAFVMCGGAVEKVSSVRESIECPKCSTTHKAQKHLETHFFACSKCTFEADLDTTALFNMLSRSGRREHVVGIIERMEKMAEFMKPAAE